MTFRSLVLCSDPVVGVQAQRGTEVNPSRMTGWLELIRDCVWHLELPGL